MFGRIDAIGVDEIQYAKGHRYLTLVYQIDVGVTRLLWVGKERTIESFQELARQKKSWVNSGSGSLPSAW